MPISDKNINICYSLYDEKGTFSKIAGTAIVSVLENTTRSVCIHLLHDNTLSEDNKMKFNRLIRSYGQEIAYYNIETLFADIYEKLPSGGRFSKGAMYRLLIGDVLPDEVERVIYLDTDTIVTLDINELWQEKTGENGLAAVPEKALTHDNMITKSLCEDKIVSEDRYFNSGVLLIDMAKYKKCSDLCTEGLKVLEKHPEWTCCDQDLLNYYFADAYHLLPLHYDIFVEAERLIENQTLIDGIYHYAGWAVDVFDRNDVYNALWFRYFIKTPWFDEKMLLNIFGIALATDSHRKEILRNLFNQTSGKRRIFFGFAIDETAVRNYFNIKENELYICVDKNNTENTHNMETLEYKLLGAVKTLTNEIKTLSADEIGIICIRYYGDVCSELVKNGLIEGENFINGMLFLPASAGENGFDGKNIITQL